MGDQFAPYFLCDDFVPARIAAELPNIIPHLKILIAEYVSELPILAQEGRLWHPPDAVYGGGLDKNRIWLIYRNQSHSWKYILHPTDGAIYVLESSVDANHEKNEKDTKQIVLSPKVGEIIAKIRRITNLRKTRGVHNYIMTQSMSLHILLPSLKYICS